MYCLEIIDTRSLSACWKSLHVLKTQSYLKHRLHSTSKKNVMVGKNKPMYNQSNESIRSEFTISLRRYSTGISDVEYSPTFPNTWKSFQQLTRFDSGRQKRYTVGAFPSPSFAQASQLSSSDSEEFGYFEDKTINAPLAKEVNASTPKRNRFSSGYILSLFLKKQTLPEQCSKGSEQHTKQKNENEQRTTVNCDPKKRRLHKINSAPNIRAKPTQDTKGILTYPYRQSYYKTFVSNDQEE